MPGYQSLPTNVPTAYAVPGTISPQQYPQTFQQPPQINYYPHPAPIIVLPPSNSADTWPKRPFGWKRANWYFTGMAIIVASCVGTVIFYANDGLLSLFSVLFTVGFFVFTVPCLCCCGKPIGMTASEQRENDEAQLEMLKRVQNPQIAPPSASNNMPSGTAGDNDQPQSYESTVEKDKADAIRRFANLSPQQAVDKYNGR
jgi:hypothetical protein